MHQQSIRVIAVVAIAIVTALAGAPRASAGGVVDISSCQTLSGFNTVYRLTTDLTSCGNCLIVAADRITVDLQGHSITDTCPQDGFAITDGGNPRDLIVVKNGSVIGYFAGVALPNSTRVSVLGITAKDNGAVGITMGPRGLVKSSEVSGSGIGIQVQDRGQVQQCNAHNNGTGIFFVGDNCLITMNTANFNSANGGIVLEGNKCTVSYNTASNNSFVGIDASAGFGGSGHLVTQNVALGNGSFDYEIRCPSTVTNNTSTNGFPTSYAIIGTNCHVVNNN